MRDRHYQTKLALVIRVATLLVFSLPDTAYAANSLGSSSGYRGTQGLSAGYSGLNRGHGRQLSGARHSPRSEFSSTVNRHSLTGRAGTNTAGNGRSGSWQDRGDARRWPSASGLERSDAARDGHDHRKKQGFGSGHGHAGITESQTITGRMDRRNMRNSTATHLNRGTIAGFASGTAITRSSVIGRHETTRHFVPARSGKNFTRPKAAAGLRDITDKKVIAPLTQHKPLTGRVHPLHHKHHGHHDHHGHFKHHGHHKHHGHFKRIVFFPLVFFSYSSFYSPYGYYPGYYPYAYPGYRYTGYSPPAYSYEEPVYPADKPYGLDRPGWTYLAQGYFQEAINAFARDIQSFPDAGIPKVGFALASAAAGDLTAGVLAMREAFHVDPDAILYLHPDIKVLAIIDDLVDKYEQELQQDNKRPDEAFMVSALRFLKRDYGSAHQAINRAIRDGDKSSSLGNLHKLVDEQYSGKTAGNNR